MSKRRVVVTGLGAVTPVGNNVQAFWESVKTGKVGIGEITRFDTADFKVKLAAEVKDFNAKDYMDFKSAKRMELFSQYAVAAAKEAMADAGIEMGKGRSFPCRSDRGIRNWKPSGNGICRSETDPARTIQG